MPQKFIPYKKWLHQHDGVIKQEYPDRPTVDMAQEIDVNYYTLSRRATRMGVGKSDAFMHTSWKKGSCKKGGWKKTSNQKKLHASSDKYMQEHFADTRNEDLARFFGVDVKTVRRWARRLGLTKSDEFMKKSRSGNKPFYTPDHIAYRNRRISEVYPDGDEESLQRLADELGVKLSSLYKLATQIGVRRNFHPPQYFAELAAYFPTHTDQACADQFGVSKSVIQNIARKYGWKKDKDYLKEIRLRNAAAANAGRRRKFSDCDKIG